MVKRSTKSFSSCTFAVACITPVFLSAFVYFAFLFYALFSWFLTLTVSIFYCLNYDFLLIHLITTQCLSYLSPFNLIFSSYLTLIFVIWDGLTHTALLLYLFTISLQYTLQIYFIITKYLKYALGNY